MEWNEELIEVLIQRDVEQILSIPLGRNGVQDKWIWAGTSDGKFSV